MSDPDSKAELVDFVRLDADDAPGHRPYVSTTLAAIVVALVNQINTLRDLHGLPAITRPQAKAEIARLRRIIEGLQDGT